LCSNYLSHVLAKLDDNSVPVKKAAIKAIRQYPQMIANNTFALQRLTRCAPCPTTASHQQPSFSHAHTAHATRDTHGIRFLNTFAEE
jgi:hypothetical protein